MRGYGTLQTMTALEVLVDEVASALPIDPIEFRRRNALRTGGRTMTGNAYSVSVRTWEILDKLDKHPIWQNRAAEKAKAKAGIVVGTERSGLDFALLLLEKLGDQALGSDDVGMLKACQSLLNPTTWSTLPLDQNAALSPANTPASGLGK